MQNVSLFHQFPFEIQLHIESYDQSDYTHF